MSAINGWLGTGVAVMVLGLCFLLMRYGHHLPSMTHPWQHRLVIFLAYCAGAALLVTTAGAWVLHELEALAGWFGGTAPGSGAIWALTTIGALFLFLGVVVALIWTPDTGVAYIAVITPLALALTGGGIAYQIYLATTAPAQQLAVQIAHWAGG